VKTEDLPWESDTEQTLYSFIDGKEDVLYTEINKNGQIRSYAGSTKLTIQDLDENNNFYRHRWYRITLKSSDSEG
jgi:hypothetical protein